MVGEPLRHELGVRDADAETQGSSLAGPAVNPRKVLQDQLGATVCPRVQRPQAGADIEALELDEVIAASSPRDLVQIDCVAMPVVLERGQELLVEGVPEADLRGSAAVEPAPDVPSVGTLGRGGQPEEETRLQVRGRPC
jgi:hypothetical protein